MTEGQLPQPPGVPKEERSERKPRRKMGRRGFLKAIALAVTGGAVALATKEARRLEPEVIDIKPKDIDAKKVGDSELSSLNEEKFEQHRHTPPEKTITETRIKAAEAEAKPPTENETREFENRILEGINEAREEENLTKVKRIEHLDGASMFAADYNAKRNKDKLTHSVPYEDFKQISLEQLEGVKINKTITDNDLTKIGLQPPYVARSNTRANLGSYKIDGSSNPTKWYGAQGGVTEILFRGPVDTKSEDVIQAYLGSEHHREAMLGKDYIHAGVIVVIGKYGKTVCVGLGKGLNKRVPWKESTRGNISPDPEDLKYRVYAPSIFKGSGSISSAERVVPQPQTSPFKSPVESK